MSKDKLTLTGTLIKNDEYQTALLASPPPPTITFLGDNQVPIMKLESNGDIYVKGKLVENDKEVVEGMRALLAGVESYWKQKHDELGKEWVEYTDEWNKTITMLEEESLAKDKKIAELEEYKHMYEELCK